MMIHDKPKIKKYRGRKSIRLKGYDYTTPASYFITICVQKNTPLFGEVKNGKMIVNEAGKMIDQIWNEIPAFYPGFKIDIHQTMPDHFHGIITITPSLWLSGQLQIAGIIAKNSNKIAISLPDIVHRFKSMTTNQYIYGVKYKGWQPFNQRLWHRNYYERIIRNKAEFNRIYKYIKNNPANMMYGQTPVSVRTPFENTCGVSRDPGSA
jgi:REP element-mobilizing transposase RayT